MTTIVVPLDGSELADRAVAYAIPIARGAGGTLRLVRACMSVSPMVLDSGSAVRVAAAVHAADLHDAQVAMERWVAGVRETRLPVEGIVRCGSAADVILEEIEAAHADLVVMTTHGRGGLGRSLYGSVADEVLRRADIPILLVPTAAPEAQAGDRPRRVLVALDGSELAEASLEPAVDLARALGADLALLRVVDPLEDAGKYVFVRTERARARRYLQRVVRQMLPPCGEASLHVRVGHVVPTILAAAAALRVDVVALGTHGRSGLSRLVMGSVATGLLQQATGPLLLVPAQATRRSTPFAPRARKTSVARRVAVEGRGVQASSESG